MEACKKLVGPTNDKKVALIYCRVGTKNNVQIYEQSDTCAYYCEQNGIEVYGTVIDDGFSGGSFDRPGFHKIMDVVSNQGNGGIPLISYVICTDPSRFSRDTDLAKTLSKIQEIKSHGAEVIYLNQSLDSYGENKIIIVSDAENNDSESIECQKQEFFYSECSKDDCDVPRYGDLFRYEVKITA